jgi:hypothetical protein
MDYEYDENRTKLVMHEAEFKKMYQYLTSVAVKEASDKLFSATAEELAAYYKPDNDQPE